MSRKQRPKPKRPSRRAIAAQTKLFAPAQKKPG